MRTSDLEAGMKVRYYGTGNLSRRTSAATVTGVEGRAVTLKTDAGNVFTLDISRIARVVQDLVAVGDEAAYAAQPSQQCSHQGVCFHPSL